MGSFSKGWSDVLPISTGQSNVSAGDELLLGHVISVDYEETFGKIKVRILNNPHNGVIEDKDITTEAYPGNVNMIKYPLPGELVLIVQAITKVQDIQYYYITTITSGQDVLYNSNPMYLTSVPAKWASRIFTPSFKERFKENFVNIDKFVKTNGSLKERGPLYPTEGDFVVQGRFGGAIRFSSTGNKHNWSEKKESKSEVGDPIVAITVNKRDTEKSIYENINKDNSSIYFCSTQLVKIDLSTSLNLKTHKHKYDIKDKVSSDSDITKFIDTPYQPMQSAITTAIVSAQGAVDGGTASTVGNISANADVIFVAGLISVIPLDQQVANLKKGLGNDKSVKAFLHSDSVKTITDYIASHTSAYVFLYSAGCVHAKAVSSVPGIVNSKVYVVEPYSPGSAVKSVQTAAQNGVPLGNIFLGPSADRGNGILTGTSKTPSGMHHGEALTNAAKLAAGIKA